MLLLIKSLLLSLSCHYIINEYEGGYILKKSDSDKPKEVQSVCYSRYSQLDSEIYPAHNLSYEINLACKRNARVFIFNASMTCGDLCSATSLRVENSTVCHQGTCYSVQSEIKQVFKLDDYGYLSINNTIQPCNIIDSCSIIEFSLLIPHCNKYAWILLTMLLSIVSFLVLIPIMMVLCLIFNKLNIQIFTKKDVEIKNCRRKIINGKVKYVKGSRAHSHSNRKIKSKHSVMFWAFMMIIGTIKACDNSADIISAETSCVGNTSCAIQYKIYNFFDYTGQKKCFLDQTDVVKVELISVDYSCELDTLYYVPIYEIRQESKWHCPGAGFCNSDGSFDKSNKNLFDIDVMLPGDRSLTCWYGQDRCKRISLKFNNTRKEYCKVSKCSKLVAKYVYLVRIAKSEQIFSLVEGERKTLFNYIFLLEKSNSQYKSDTIIDCPDRYITRMSNMRNEHFNQKYGLLQCPDIESAKSIDMSKCKTDVTQLVTVLGTDLLISKNDNLFSDLNSGLSIAKPAPLSKVLGVSSMIHSEVVMRVNSTHVSHYDEDVVKGVKNLTLSGEYGSFEGSVMSFYCTSDYGYFFITCSTFFKGGFACVKKGYNSKQVTLNYMSYPPSVGCQLSWSGKKSIPVILQIRANAEKITLFNEEYIDIDYQKVVNDNKIEIDLLSILKTYIVEHSTFTVPVILITIMLISLKVSHFITT